MSETSIKENQTAVPSATGSTVASVEQQLDEIDALFAQLDAGEFDVGPLNYPWPEAMKLSIVIPVFNEEATIGKVVAKVNALRGGKELASAGSFCITCSPHELPPAW